MRYIYYLHNQSFLPPSFSLYRNLRARLYKQSYEFVKQQRIACLMCGAWFPSPSTSRGPAGSIPAISTPGIMITPPAAGTGKRWRFYRLSPNRRMLHWGEFAERVGEIAWEAMQEKSGYCDVCLYIYTGECYGY